MDREDTIKDANESVPADVPAVPNGPDGRPHAVGADAIDPFTALPPLLIMARTGVGNRLRNQLLADSHSSRSINIGSTLAARRAGK